MLEDAGLRPFWTELNLLDVNVLRRGPLVAEVSATFSPAFGVVLKMFPVVVHKYPGETCTARRQPARLSVRRVRKLIVFVAPCTSFCKSTHTSIILRG
jgi:hypothetical protein